MSSVKPLNFFEATSKIFFMVGVQNSMLIPNLALLFRFDHGFSSYGPKTVILWVKMGFLPMNSNVDVKHTIYIYQSM